MASTAPTPVFDVASLTGPWAIGFILSSILFGVLLVQVGVYYVNFPKEMIGIRILVYVVVTLEFLYTAISGYVAWDNFGTKWGNAEALLTLGWSWAILTILTGLFSLFTQCFFAWRVYKLSKIWYALPIIGLSLAQFFGLHYFGFSNFRDGDTLLGLVNYTPYINLWLIGSAVCDILITISMVTILLRAAAGSGFRQTSHVLTKIARFTVETNLVTSVGAIIELILYRTMPNNGFHFLMYLTLGRLYSNVLLGSLNSRILFTERRVGYISASDSLAPSLWADMISEGNRRRAEDNLRVNVDTNKVIRNDQGHQVHEMTVMGTETEDRVDSKGLAIGA